MNAPLTTPFPGFPDPVYDSQAVFRIVLDAMARPGRVLEISDAPAPPAPLAPAAGAICLCLLDQSTEVWLDETLQTDEVLSYLTFHTGCVATDDPSRAHFAVVAGLSPKHGLDGFCIGDPEYPDRSTTVIVQTPSLRDGTGVRLTGPGIETESFLDIDGFGPDQWQAVQQNNALFPMGPDLLFVQGNRIAGLPRSVTVGV